MKQNIKETKITKFHDELNQLELTTQPKNSYVQPHVKQHKQTIQYNTTNVIVPSHTIKLIDWALSSPHKCNKTLCCSVIAVVWTALFYNKHADPMSISLQELHNGFTVDVWTCAIK